MSEIIAIVLAAILAIVAVTLAFYLTRSSPVRALRWLGDGRSGELAVGEPIFRETVSLLTQTPIVGGHVMEVLANGDETYPRLFDDLRRAESLITWQVFWMKPGRLATEVRDILAERARSGVRVLVLLDYFGAAGLREDFARTLRQAGAEVAIFRPPRWNELYKAQQRMHVRSVVVDGRIGYTGGFGIDDRWAGNGTRPGQWRDTNVRIEGPGVDRLQVSFAMNWAETCGELLAGPEAFAPRDERPGKHEVGVVHGVPSLGSTIMERLIVLSILGACDRLWFTNAYFLPDAGQRRMLTEAAARGVDVRILTPGDNSDRKSAYLASRSHYEELIAGGVRVYEYDPAMVHAKTFVVDGKWSSIGTVNFDNRSMKLNDEVAVVTTEPGIAAHLEKLFTDDLGRSTEIALEKVRARGTWARMKERAARVVAPLL